MVEKAEAGVEVEVDEVGVGMPIAKAVNKLTHGSLGLVSHGSESKSRNQ